MDICTITLNENSITLTRNEHNFKNAKRMTKSWSAETEYLTVIAQFLSIK